jgi:hypothetical protein
LLDTPNRGQAGPTPLPTPAHRLGRIVNQVRETNALTLFVPLPSLR